MEEADKFFYKKDYQNALRLYRDLELLRLDDAYLRYKIGICYYHAEYARRKAIPHFQFCIKHKKKSPIPDDVHYYLARTYHIEDMYSDAIQEYEEYINLIRNVNNPTFTDAPLQIERCKIALEQLKPENKKNLTVEILSFPINSSYDDYSPQVTSKGAMMVFASNRRPDATNLIFGDNYSFLPKDLVWKQSDVYVTFRKGLDFKLPFEQNITKNGSFVSTVSINSDGTLLLLCIGNQTFGQGSLYLSRFKGGKWLEPKSVKMPDKSRIFGACFAYNQRKIIYSSNKPGGYGGFDIYTADIDETGVVTNPVNMGGKVNSNYDEVTPFWVSQNKLYFSSNGLNSVGGFDIFSSEFGRGEWSNPVSLGIPINSGADELFYVSYSNDKYGYFSTNRESDINSKGGWDIASVFRPETQMPFTLVKGTIKVLQNNKMIPVKLLVNDLIDDTPQKYIYNPDTNGKYFMILAHNRSYKIKIEYGNNLWHEVQLDIPKDAHNYEMNHEITVKPIALLGNVIGEESAIEKSEYKLSKRNDVDTAVTTDIRYDALVLLMERIIDMADAEGLTQIDNLEKINQEVALREKQKEFSADEYYTPLVELVEKAIAKGDTKLLLNLDKPRTNDTGRRVFIRKPYAKGKYLIMSHQLNFKRNNHEIDSLQQKEIADLALFLYQNSGVYADFYWTTNESAPDEYTQAKITLIKEILTQHKVSPDRFTFLKNDQIPANPDNPLPYINIEVRFFEYE